MLMPSYEGFPDTLYFDEIMAAILKDSRQLHILCCEDGSF